LGNGGFFCKNQVPRILTVDPANKNVYYWEVLDAGKSDMLCIVTGIVRAVLE